MKLVSAIIFAILLSSSADGLQTSNHRTPLRVLVEGEPATKEQMQDLRIGACNGFTYKPKSDLKGHPISIYSRRQSNVVMLGDVMLFGNTTSSFRERSPVCAELQGYSYETVKITAQFRSMNTVNFRK